MAHQHHRKLNQVVVWCGDLVDKTVWRFGDKNPSIYGQHGGTRHNFKLKGEHIVEISCHQGDMLDGISFITDTGRRSQWFGGRGGSPQSFRARPGHEIVGLRVAQGKCPKIHGIVERPINAGQQPHRHHPVPHQQPHAHGPIDPNFKRVTKVEVHSGSLVDRTVFHYMNHNPSSNGGRGGNKHEFTLGPREWITRIDVRVGSKTDQIMLTTNTGRKSQRFGGNGGKHVKFEARPGHAIVSVNVQGHKCPQILSVNQQQVPPQLLHHHKPVAEAVAGVINGIANTTFAPPPTTMGVPGRSITQIEVYAGSMVDHIQIYYTQGPPLMTGRMGGERQRSFVVNHQAGEKITGINTIQNAQNLVGVQFLTNQRMSDFYGNRNGHPQNFVATPGMSILGIQVAGDFCPKIVGLMQEPMQQNTFSSAPMPGGTWMQTARNQRMQGNILYCELQNVHGQWIQASVMCSPGQMFSNNNGRFELMHN